MPTIRDLLTEAAEELGVVQQGDALSANDADLLLRRYKRLLDFWNAKRGAIYADRFDTFTIAPATQPQTIGPSGATWTYTTVRPVKIDGASLWLGSSPDVKRPLRVWNGPDGAAWWHAQRVPSLASAYPTDLYYQPDFPLGKVYLWPDPSSALQVELWTRLVLASAAITLDTDFSLPPAYWRAHVLTVAEESGPALGTPASADTKEQARQAREAMFSVNRIVPRIATRDAGMPGGGSGKTYDYLTREV